VLIAWALLKADARWHDKRYSAASDAITKALIAHNVIRYAGYRVMLPGVQGFKLDGEVVLNPSYFVFPAWQAFAGRSHLPVWRELIKDGNACWGKWARVKRICRLTGSRWHQVASWNPPKAGHRA
jgi:endoglucanase